MSGIRRSDVSGMLHAFHGGELFHRGRRGGAGVSPGIVTIRNMVPPTAASGLYSTAGCVFDPVGFTRDYASVEEAYNDYVANGIMLDVTLPDNARFGHVVPIISLEPIGVGQLGRGMFCAGTPFGAFLWTNTSAGSTYTNPTPGAKGWARIRSVSSSDRIRGIPPIELCAEGSGEFRVLAMFAGEIEYEAHWAERPKSKTAFAILVPTEVERLHLVSVAETRTGTNGTFPDVSVYRVGDNFTLDYTAVETRKFPAIELPAGIIFVADREKLLYMLNPNVLGTAATAVAYGSPGEIAIEGEIIRNARCEWNATIPYGSSIYAGIRVGTNSAQWIITGVACNNIYDLSNDVKTLLAKNHAIQVAENSSVTLNVLQNATYPTGATVTTTSVTTPTNGTAAIVQNMVIYTPRANFSGSDSFKYTLQCGTETSTGNVTVTVNPLLPTARPDNITTAFETPIVFSPILNDSVSAGRTATVSSVTQGVNGTVTNLGGGQVRYSPKVGFAGIDTFTYRLYDGTANGYATGTVTVLVTPAGY